MTKEYAIEWSKVNSCGVGVSGGKKKILLDNLPRGGKYLPKNRINWVESVGKKVYVLYEEKEYVVTIDNYDKKTAYLTINIEGYNKVDYKIHTGNFTQCKLNSLISNIYANPNSPNRELILKSVGEDEAKTLTPYSNKKIQIVCPDCGATQNIELCKLTERGFRCNRCSDKFPYPERLVRSVLNRLEIAYLGQLTYDNGKTRYDFFLPDFNVIIETHGIQHYEETRRNKRTRTLEEEQKNDRYKRKLAIENGIKDEDYHEIDCRISTLEWCRPNIEKVINLYAETILADEDWEQIALDSLTNTLVEICKQYEIRRCSSLILASEFNIDATTVQKYLKKGDSLGLCSYKGREEQHRRASIPIVGIHVETGQRIEFKSYNDATRKGFKHDSIRRNINGETKHYRNYVWEKMTK